MLSICIRKSEMFSSPAPTLSPGPGPLCRRSCRGAESAGHHWSNLPVPVWIRPIKKQLRARWGRFQEEFGCCGRTTRRCVSFLFSWLVSDVEWFSVNYVIMFLFSIFRDVAWARNQWDEGSPLPQLGSGLWPSGGAQTLQRVHPAERFHRRVRTSR